MLYVSLFFIEPPMDRLFKHGIPTFVVFILTFEAFQNRSVPKFLIVLGNISYSLYLTHTFIITSFSKIIFDIDHINTITVSSIIASALAISIVIGVAYISWYLIEYKLANWIKIKLEK